MLLEITDGSVSLGGETVLGHFDFAVRGREKIALVGRNGAGKTTLLRVLSGELELDANEKNPLSGLRRSRAFRVGMLRQTREEDMSLTVEELIRRDLEVWEPESREHAAARTEVDRLFTGFGFSGEDKARTLGQFSGGEQTRIELIRLLMAKPELLLLDEPTNHLDVAAAEWLEDSLRSYPGAVVMVSHDRFFLDQTADAVVEISRGKLTRYAGNYTAYRREKLARLQRGRQAYRRQQQEIRRLEDLIERFKNKPRKAAFARSRRKILERMERLEAPEEDDARLHTGEILPAARCSKIPVETEDLQIGYDRAIAAISLRVRRGQKLGILGPNGSGKSTFLKTLAGELPRLGGKLSLGNGVDLGYFGQHSAEISGEDSVLAWFRERFPVLTEQEVRRTLAGYLFSGRDLLKRICDLSGGERARLVLAALLQSRPNVLLLDEPTNHMDIPAKETLESIFQSYQGTLLFVSHDRYFLRQVADSLLLFAGEGEPVRVYPFGYDHYRERRDRQERGEELSLRRTAKEQAMIEGLRAVPKKSWLPGELSTESAWRDWRFRGLGEELSQAEGEVQRAEEAWEDVRLREWEKFCEPSGQAEEDEEMVRKQRKDTLLRSQERWLSACLAWYDAWLEVHPAENESIEYNISNDKRLDKREGGV